MHDDRTLVEARLKRVLEERIRPAVYPESVPLEVGIWTAPGEPVPVAEGLAAPRTPIAVGAAWGAPWSTSWLTVSGTVPQRWAGRTVEALIDLGFDANMPGFQCEGLVYRPDGTPVKGINPRNQWVPVGSPALGGEEVLLHVEAAANPVILDYHPFLPTDLGDKETAGDEPQYKLARMDLAVLDTTVWELVQDLEVLGELMAELPVEGARRWEILRAVDRALDALDLQDVGATAPAARELLARVLASPAEPSAHRVTAVGHAHIDSAWLWPLRETVRKVARTTANMTALLADHPEFVYTMSQAQQYAWIKEHRPEVYAKVKAAVAEGRFVPAGGMWVESDTNMPGSEAMARQFVHGKRFFLEEFGVECEEAWLPDTFGFAAGLPQIIKAAGAKWLLTQKISWSQVNRFPHHTFWWEGIDGTRIFTHFPPVDTYNCSVSGKEIAHAARNFKDKGVARNSLAPTGWGDGGGGTTREMVAKAARLRNLEGSATVEWGRPAEFFAAAQAEYPQPPVWVGELYLELHRATLTSQAGTKQGNRRSENLLREAELWAATAAVRTGFPYPYEELDRIWKTVLLHQFHDILPGSSIAWVHREAEKTYAAVAAELESVIGAAQRALAGAADGGGEVVFNAAPHERGGIPAGGARPAAPAPGGCAATARAEGGFLLDNGVLRVVVDGRGLVVSAYDVAAGRETLAPGTAANLLQIHPDFPNMWDAWDVDQFYRNSVTDLVDADEVALTADGPDAVAVRVVRSFGSSRAVQTLTLQPGAARLEFDTEVDWHETEKFLKVAFPLDVHADRYAAETQFGHLYRPTHTNTSWEAAKFEACNHRFVHVEEPGWGVAVVTASTYGHDVTRTVRAAEPGTTTTVRLSLLRAPRFPDPHTDQGVHRFRYALVPGASVGDAVREGYRVGLPERRVPGDAVVAPLVSVDRDAVVLSAVKLADDGSGDVVVRAYEAHGGRARARLTAGFTLAGAVECDLLERPLAQAAAPVVDGDTVELTLRPFQIVTLRLSRRAA
ncbi:glycoside hydrolase family 38 N-terminal domain-containing protein [Streptantibioticus cattleyicolor]|uniref:alpha-mannosidase n=1 Tax=Streptantibioticus cattleyicolor (strain ATCC 35852 / DSM 46488 / JCM 4925 / NBRC 14057 / NRRL 8057) TaxID=1003195 RepID=F8JJ03_STREN|nr:glycoside hydrolase family 38 C-terminal domain-containing protein [Streptantibioticus cattleyicolor]AEW98906.1 alpha-mannosidase [Streptantibioticus cattleyicolor NRRL 8057 = DSM 46488]CCB72047.1 Alpha-mannosidase [Streptantibioticus cattleyicolor NRRL 8057 = DSM 46488]